MLLELVVVIVIFLLFVIFGIYFGINVEGLLVNVWVIVVMFGGILFGLWVGIIIGFIVGFYCYLIDIDGIILVFCFIISIIVGLMLGYINLKVKKEW